MECFDRFGVMIDCSRNAVMTVEQVKKYILILKRMGYNQVQLYMEDTYEVDGEPLFGYLRGRYSREELREMDDFAFQNGVELVPNVQTLAHMTALLRWRGDLRDTENIFLVGNEDVYTLIDRMFSSLRASFRTEKIHIGMDEAHMLGRGRYYDQHGPQDRVEILLSHLRRVCEIADKYAFKPMMWSDMFYALACGGNYYVTDATFDPTVKEKIPKNLTLVYWDYYTHDKKRYDGMIKGHHQLSDRIVFAGGAWKWVGFAPHNDYGNRATKAAIAACKEGGIRDVFLTMWGDNGAECSSYAVLPSLCYAACMAQGITKMADIKAKCYEWLGVKYDDLMLLDLPDQLENIENGVPTPSKYFLYADCFASIFQNTEKAEYAKKYASMARRLNLAVKRAGEYGYLFDTLSKLCAVLSVKVTICTRTREAYRSGDCAQLDAVIADYKKMIRLTRNFYKAFRTQWMIENKPHGFHVQDTRLGGLIQRMQACHDCLADYRDGKVASIPELEDTIVPFVEGLICYNDWAQATGTNLYGYLY